MNPGAGPSPSRSHGAWEPLRSALIEELASAPDALLWPATSEDVPDADLMFRIVYLPPDWAELDEAGRLSRLDDWLRFRGQTRRQYRNALAFALPDPAVQREAGRALSEARSGPAPPDQAWLLALVRSLYPTLHLPAAGEGFLGECRFESLACEAGEDPTLTLHESLRRAVDPRLRRSLRPEELIRVIGLGETDCAGVQRVMFPLADLARWFFSFLNLPRLRDVEPIRRAVAQGVRSRKFGLVQMAGLPALDEFPPGERSQVRFGSEIAAGEIAFEPGVYLVWAGVFS